MMNEIIYSIIYAGLIFILACLSFLATAGLSWIIFLCFGWHWSWLIALGIYAVIVLIRWAIPSSTK